MADESARKSLGEKLVEAVQDLTSLDVTTFSGDLALKTSDPNKKYKLDELFDDIEGQITANAGKLQVIAHTHKALDGDIIQFFREGLDATGQTYLDAHKEALETATAQRQAIVNLIKELI